MTKIFISYSSKNRHLIDKLADDLELMIYNHYIWFDRELLRMGGQKWWDNILAEIRKCEIFIYAISPQIVFSVPCKREYEYALALRKSVLPVLLIETDYKSLPVDVQVTQIVPFTERTRTELIALRDSIHNLPKITDLPDPLPTPPDTPLDPISSLTNRINNLAMDPRLQRNLLLDIEDLNDDAHYRKQVPQLLENFIARDDVLIARNLRLAEEVLARVLGTTSRTYTDKLSLQRTKKVTEAAIAYLRDHPEHKTLSGRQLEKVAATDGLQVSYRTWNDVKKLLIE